MGGFRTKLSALLGRLFGGSRDDAAARIVQMPEGDKVVWGAEGAEMDQAIQAAQETLSVFWSWHETRPEDPNSCALKVMFPAKGGGGEHIWLIDIRRNGEFVTGIVAGEPDRVRGLKAWQPVRFEVEHISDWTFHQEGLDYGHFTTRVMATAYPELGPLPETLSETPLPADIVRH